LHFVIFKNSKIIKLTNVLGFWCNINYCIYNLFSNKLISSIFVFSTDNKTNTFTVWEGYLMWSKFTIMICEDEIVELKFKNKN